MGNSESRDEEPAPADLSRRDVIKLGAAVTLSATLGAGDALAGQAATPARTFFTPAELALVDELSEMIVPADDHSPGARATRVAAYIDARLAEAFEPEERTAWRNGLKLVDDLSRKSTGKPFLQSSPEERLQVLTGMAQNEGKPQKPEEEFFSALKQRVIHAYYTSEIGIKQEMEYKGNTYLAEFVGIDVSQ
jgi:hypothetical protein